MSLLAGLSNARSGLAATNLRTQIAWSNIANVSTPGYVRRDAVLSSQAQGGVRLDSVSRVQDEALLQSRRDAQSQAAGSAVTDAVLQRTLSAFGEPGDQTGIFGSLARFEGDLQTLRSTPESAAAQSIAVDSLKDFAGALSRAAQDLQGERTNADAQVANDVANVNKLAEELFSLNGQIRKSHSAAADTASLLDQRDQLIDSISEVLPVQADYEDSGAVRLQTRTGLNLVGPTVNAIEFTQSVRIGAADLPTDQGGRLSVPTLNGQPLSPGSGVHALTGGRLAANIDLRDNQIPQQAASLDDFAFDLASAFDGAGEPLLLDGLYAVDPLNKTGLAERIIVNPLVDPARGEEASRLRDGVAAAVPGAPGNDTVLTNLTNALAPFADRLGEVISEASSASFRASRIHTGNTAREVSLVEADTAHSAVDLDNELQSLLQIEQAYAANARVIQTINDMFDILSRI